MGEGVSEDVVFDPLIYDYILPASKEVDALTTSPAPGRGESRSNARTRASIFGTKCQSSIRI